jgi:hypothetical protein
VKKNIEIQGLVALDASEQVEANGGRRGGGRNVDWRAIGRRIGRWISRQS